MLAALCHALLAFAPRRTHKPHPVADDEWHKVWYFIDDNGEILFPILAVALIALIVLGVRRGMKSNTLNLQKKQDQKDFIVRMMRSKLLVSADAVAVELHTDRFAASALLDELVREGKLVEQKSTGGVANYRLKGL